MRSRKASGRRPGPSTLGPGLTSIVIRDRRSLRLDRAEQARELGAITYGSVTESWLGVPIMAGDTVIGVIGLEDLAPAAFDEATERVLSTLASSMAVALQNAALFDETRRLFAEADERAAELAIVNGIQQGLAAELDMQSMYELVGDKLQEIFDAQVVDIGIYDLEAGVTHFPYAIERGVRYPDEPTPFATTTLEFIAARAPLMIPDVPAWERERGEEILVVQGEPSLSIVRVPMIVGGEVRGGISLQNLDRTEAFSDGDLRLLTTLAASLTVALENARLMAETRRLLTEADERAAELSIVNRVQDGLARRLDIQAMYDLVGDTVIEIFDAQVVDIGILDPDADCIRFPYTIERGVRFAESTMPVVGMRRHVLETREPLLINEDASARAVAAGQPAIIEGEEPKSTLWAPLIDRDVAIGVISIQNLDREGAFSDRDLRLITTLASSLSLALENARLSREAHRRADEMAALADIGRDISGMLDPREVIERIAGHAQAAVRRGLQRRLPGGAGRTRVSRDHRPGRAVGGTPAGRHRARRGDHRRRHRRSTGGRRQRRLARPAHGHHPGHRARHGGAVDGRPAHRPRVGARGDGRVARGELADLQHERSRPAGRPVAARRDRPRERPALPRRPGGDGRGRGARTRPRARSWPR